MIDQFDVFVVRTQTGRSAFRTEEQAREAAARAYPADQKVELVTLFGMDGQAHQAWIMRPRKQAGYGYE